MFEWENSFQPHILERGWRYAQSGAVKHLIRNAEELEAVVLGTEYYRVKMTLDGHTVLNAYCSCPYASDGSYCKHMAAVLYEADRDTDQKTEVCKQNDFPESNDVISIVDVIHGADRDKLEAALLELAESDVKIESRIRSILGGTFSPSVSNISVLKKEIDGIFLAYSGRGGFIDYNDAMAFEADLCRYLENQSDQLIREGRYRNAFEISMYAYIKLGNWGIDDDGEIQGISDTCCSIWRKIISNCPEQDRAWIKISFEQIIHQDIGIDYMAEVLQEFLQYELASQEELKTEIEHLDQLIEESGDSNKCTTVFTHCYGPAVEAIELRIILMKKLGCSEEQIDAFRRTHWKFQSVRKYYIERAQSEGDEEEEIKILKESKVLDANSVYLIRSYSRRLMELYKKHGQFDLEKTERKEAFLSFQMSTVEDFREYRRMCTEEEWQKEKILLIYSRKDRDKRCELLAEENMLPELFAQISESDNKLNYYNKYGFLLAGLYDEQILEEYRKHVCSIAEYARGRSAYGELVRYLLRMNQYEGGPATVKNLCREWTEQYSTRKVMLQELQKAMDLNISG